MASVRFSFKGETFDTSSVIDLDAHMKKNKQLPAMDHWLARENNIDTYSYLYEVMQQSDVLFNQPQGLAEKFHTQGAFDIAGFEQHWHEQEVVHQLENVVKEELAINDLSEHPALKKALMQAYRLGSESTMTDRTSDG